MFEIDGVPKELAEKAFELASGKAFDPYKICPGGWARNIDF